MMLPTSRFVQELCYLAIMPLSEVSALDSLYNNQIEPGMHDFLRNSIAVCSCFQIFFLSYVLYLTLQGVLW